MEQDQQKPNDFVQVTIGPKFLTLFSDQLYKSPNKAFEELVSNSWDAGAENVHIGVPGPQSDTVWVLDDGQSMDLDGLDRLWSVAISDKPSRETTRPQIGKFGIGKLSTYVLAEQLTYICCAEDGVIRSVEMDYRLIEENDPERLHIDPISLPVQTLTEDEALALLEGLTGSADLADLVRGGVSEVNKPDSFVEFSPGQQHEGRATRGANDDDDDIQEQGTWTAAVLNSLKAKGRSISIGHLRRMLSAALPLGADIGISLNGHPIEPSKVDADIAKRWVIGPDYNFEQIAYEFDGESKIASVSHDADSKHLSIAGLDHVVTGTVTLYEDRLTGRAEERGGSHGFRVNVRGRVVNVEEPYFGLDNLSHSVWARFRAAVRIDGLNASMAVDRDKVQDTEETAIVRGLLQQLFNEARREHDAMGLPRVWLTGGCELHAASARCVSVSMSS